MVSNWICSLIHMSSESKIGFENRDPGFELKTETGFQNWWKPVFKEPKIA